MSTCPWRVQGCVTEPASTCTLTQACSHNVQGPLKTLVGTIDFMAPEILRVPRRPNYKTDAEYRAAMDACPGFGLGVDVWALGVTVYEALSGRRPWLSRDKVHPVLRPGSLIPDSSVWLPHGLANVAHPLFGLAAFSVGAPRADSCCSVCSAW
jgi:serine/threonine protein kinase